MRGIASPRIAGLTLGGLALACAFPLPGHAVAQESAPPAEALKGAFPARKSYSPYAGREYPTRVFWGDTHLHTSASMDAGAFGNRLGIEEAYRFARGEEVTSSMGMRVRLSRPLDFLAVADHSDNMGFFPALFSGKPEILAHPTGMRWHDMVHAGGEEAVKAALEIIDAFSRGTFPKELYSAPGSPAYGSAWEHTIGMADRYNDPGRFTAFIGYEWTSQVPPGNNLHRVVIYRDGGDRAGQTEPFTTYPPAGSTTPEDLWKALQSYQEKSGGRVLAIAHNGNLSNGMMFPWVENPATRQPLTREYAETRARWEPLYEATQIKGDGEAHPFLSPNDEFAAYEDWDKGNLNLSEAKKPEMLQGEYLRTALQTGLLLEQRLGVNPYKFGLVGSTDSHTSLATAEEENFFGKHAGTEPNPGRISHPAIKVNDLAIMGWQQVASGYAAVWASENTREALFDAMMRKETYATTGSRMIVRFFGGFDFVAADAQGRMPAAVGYEKGVPMGGDLRAAPEGKAPTFLVAALKDPLGGNLDRIQIVKGWADGKGARQENVVDVVWSGDRKPDPRTGKLPPVGNTVDVPNATWTNTIGAPELIGVWKDPEFDPALRAVYYARVIEIPTPRWTAYDAKRFGIQVPKEVPMTTQERAYTSPIWYTPAK
ncbi:MAG: DUF3604 domain-containing protein [Planctomycetes bacterium]|nr:DUF3604 domain-containing protein [Planctomycetota bacterium]